jgi:pyruvate kinase
MKDRKGVNVPNVRLAIPYISKRDREDILFGVEQGFDYIAASFVRTADDVQEIRRLLEKVESDIRIIAKIENQEGLSNLSEILAAADGIMIARGDMGVEIDFTEIPIVQKDIIRQCILSGKPVITATQMLDSMMENPRPTRAEITDVANAIYDGTSAIMLSGETAAGKYPIEAVKTMAAIAVRTEADINYGKRMKNLSKNKRLSVAAATAHAACTTAMEVGADAILTVSQRGITARLVSRFRPETPVVALLLDEKVQRQMALYWGVEPITMPYADNTDELVDLAIRAAEKAGFVKHGDLVVVTAGVPVGISGTTNMIRVCQVGGALVNATGIGDKKAVGPLCVCRTVEAAAEKFRPGDVLVVPYSTNELLPYIRQAAAVISEEGSTDGHAATVGLTLDIPVIVGAVGATRRLQDGTVVSVDCARGVVQTMLR